MTFDEIIEWGDSNGIKIVRSADPTTLTIKKSSYCFARRYGNEHVTLLYRKIFFETVEADSNVDKRIKTMTALWGIPIRD